MKPDINPKYLNRVRKVRVRKGVEHFQCSGECGKWLPRDAFFERGDPYLAGGISSQCKVCLRAYERARRKCRELAAGIVRRTYVRRGFNKPFELRTRAQRDADWKRRLAEKGIKPVSQPVLVEKTLPPQKAHPAPGRRSEAA